MYYINIHIRIYIHIINVIISYIFYNRFSICLVNLGNFLYFTKKYDSFHFFPLKHSVICSVIRFPTFEREIYREVFLYY